MKTLDSKRVTTRKIHRCFMCDLLFTAGTVMLSETVVSSGDGIYTLYTCAVCERISTLVDLTDGHVYWPSCVAELLADYRVNTPKELLTVLLLIAGKQFFGRGQYISYCKEQDKGYLICDTPGCCDETFDNLEDTLAYMRPFDDWKEVCDE